MELSSYDIYDKAVADFYGRVIRAGYHTQNRYLDQLLCIIPEGSSVLELGCGTGELLKPLARKGRRVEGVDKSHDMLVNLYEEYPTAVIHPVDIRTFDSSLIYDYIFSCNGVFSIKEDELESYLLDENELVDCLRKFSRMSKNGLIVNKGKDKDGLRLPLNGGEFVHREFREKDIAVMIHLGFSQGRFIVERTHVKRRYSLEKIVGKSNLKRLTEDFSSITF